MCTSHRCDEYVIVNKKDIKMKYIGILVVSFMFSTTARAEDGPVIYKEKTEVDFEAVDVEGELRKPPGQVIMNRTNAMFNQRLSNLVCIALFHKKCSNSWKRRLFHSMVA